MAQLAYTNLVDGDKPAASGFNTRYLLPINLLNSGIEADNIASNAVTTAKIANNAVDGTKIAMGSDAQGDILYYNGTDYVRLAPGTSGHYLQTQGAAANPQWAQAGASLEFVSETTISADSSIDITGVASGYDYIFSLQNVLPATDNVRLWCRTSSNAGSSYDNGASDYTDVDGAGASAQLAISGAVGNATGEGASLDVILFNPADTTHTHLSSTGVIFTSAGARTGVSEGGKRDSAADVDAIQFLAASGNLASGKITVWRRKRS